MNEQTNIFLKVLQIGVEKHGETISFSEIIAIMNEKFTIPDKMIPSIR
jgi:hypothetical protein